MTLLTATNIDFSLCGGAESLDDGREFSSLPLKGEVEQSNLDQWGNASPRTVVVNSPHSRDHVGAPQDPSDFLWLMTEEPHRTRRMQILKAHPEVTKLMGHEPLTKYVVLFVVSLQLVMAYLLRNTSPTSALFITLAYAIGGTANHNLFLAIHEITHNLTFKGIKANKLFGMVANLPIVVPYSVSFKKSHIEHHKNLGEEGIDTDAPTRFEMLCLTNVLGKTFYCTFLIIFYAIRPNFVRAQTQTRWHAANFVVQFGFDYLIYQTLGGRALLYLLLSSFFAGSLHPCAAHFIAEHYVWDGMEQETYSYYGPLNWVAYNVGYHNEHHDFPSIPWTRLPALRAMAPEFYDNIPSHPSWPMVILNFIRDPNVGMYSRVKRLSKEAKSLTHKQVEVLSPADISEGEEIGYASDSEPSAVN